MGEPRDVGVTAGHSEAAGVVARNAFHLVVGQIATTVLAIALNSALGRFLGAKDFGIFYLISTLATLAYVFVQWGQPLYVIRHLAREPRRTGDMLGSALALRALIAGLVVIPAWLLAWILRYEASAQWFSILFILASLPLSLAQCYGMVFRSRDRMGLDAVVAVSNKVFVLCIALPMLALGTRIPGVILAHALAGLAAVWVATRLYRRVQATPLRVSIRTARELLTGGAPILVMTAAVYAQPFLDAVMLSKLAPAQVLGWFGAARTILGTLMAPAAILAQASYPRLARTSTEPNGFRREVGTALRMMLWLGALGGVGTYLFADMAIALIYGSRGFQPAATILEVFAPGLFLLFVNMLLATAVYALGQSTVFAVVKVTSVVVGVGLNFVLIPWFQGRYGNGGIGVVVSFALSEFVVVAGALLALRRGTLGRAAILDAVRALGAAAATGLLFHVLPPVPSWIGLPLCVGWFTLASLAFGLVHRSDLTLLLSTLSARSRRPAPGQSSP